MLTSINDLEKRIWMAYVGHPDAFVEVIRMLYLWVSCASPRSSPDRRSAPRVLLGKSGWGWSGWECVSRVIRRCVPRVIRGRGPYNFLVLFLNLFYLLLWNQGRKDWKNQSFTTIDKGPTNKWSNGSHELLFGKLVAGEKATTQY